MKESKKKGGKWKKERIKEWKAKDLRNENVKVNERMKE